jgi:hypothetical protein
MEAGSFGMSSVPRTANPIGLGYAPVTHRARLIRRATLGIFFLAAATFAIAWGWRLAKQLQYLWVQRDCMTYTLPPDQPVVQNEIATAAGLAATVKLQRLGVPNCSWPVLFMHERFASPGSERLVVVQLWGSGLIAQAGKPATLSLGSRMDTDRTSLQPLDADTFFAGQLDPRDASHFTIGYEHDGKPGTIDGWLMNDDTVKLEVRDGPLKRK